MITKRLPVGIDDFEKLRKWDCYYIDKTDIISELVRDGGEVNLFTRPRRFGKSLNMSMLRHFFEIGTDKSIFDGLKIAQDKAICDEYMGKFPVVSISLKGVGGLNFEEAYKVLCDIIREETIRLSYLLDSQILSDIEKQMLESLVNGSRELSEIKRSLKLLCMLLEKHHGQKTILLIDEYDVPLDKARAGKYYPQMIDVIKGLFEAALKTNTGLYMAVMTWCGNC